MTRLSVYEFAEKTREQQKQGHAENVKSIEEREVKDLVADEVHQ